MADIKLARKRFKYADDALKNQRQREKDDLGFYEGETQWSDDIKSLRAGRQAQNNAPAVPARPCLTINKVRDPIRKIQNDELQADLGMSITAADDFNGSIDENEIELREGLARRIQRQSNAKDARMWAANRAAICGTGWYGVSTRYLDGHSFDQELCYERFHDQFSLLPDPNHEQPDGSDVEYFFEGRDEPWDVYKDKYPKLVDGRRNPLAADDVSESQWRAFCDDAPDWIKYEGENRSVRVTRYWSYEREHYEIVQLPDGQVLRADALDAEMLKLIPRDQRRQCESKRVIWSLIDGVNTLDEGVWPGKRIPRIKIVGEEIHVFDQERRCEGLVRPARDPQKAYNAMVSNAVETIAMGPRSRWIVANGALENFEDIWQQSAVRNWPYLPYNAIDPGTGQPIDAPRFENSEPPIQAMALMIGAFDQSIMATIGQANLADTHPDVRSGAMASRLLDEAARGTSNYLANLIRSVHYEGEIVNELLYPIYGIRPGRIVSMMSDAEKPERVMIGQPFVTTTEGGMPQPHDPNNPDHAERTPKTYTLTKDGSFNVAIEATKFAETKSQERLALMAGVIEKSPEQLAIIGDLFFEAAGDSEMAKRYKAVLAPPVQQMLREGQPVDPRLEQAMQQGQLLAQEVTQLRADKGARMEQAQIKAIADTAISDKDNETKVQIAKIQQETAVMVADLKATVQQQTDANAAIAEQMRTLIELLHEQRLTERQREHERDTMHHEHAHELGMAAVEHRHAKAEMSHEADVMPKPSTNGSGE